MRGGVVKISMPIRKEQMMITLRTHIFRAGTLLVLGLAALAACASPVTPAPAQAPTLAPTSVPATVPPGSTLPPASTSANPTTGPAAAKIPALTFRNAMRKLWEDHITFTRLYIISVAHDLPDKDATAQRLLANQADIGNAIKPFYGDAAGEKLTSLLRDHILGAADLLAA